MTKKIKSKDNVADAFLLLLKNRGIKYFFANAGTDFTPLIEAFAKAEALNIAIPEPITVPHENVAMALAMGYTMITGEPQIVMVHTNVGTANALCQILNTNRLNLPIIIAAGRTPFSEDGVKGGRTIDIHWTQEMFDQASMVREAVKWDYELRNANQLEAVVDRALNISKALPKGPVYLTLPREILATEIDKVIHSPATQHSNATAPYPDVNVIDQLAECVMQAKNPMIVTSQLGNITAAVKAVSDLAERYAIPVTQYRPRTLNIATNHSMHMGFNPALLFNKADLIIAIECEVPWIPSQAKPLPNCKVAHIAADPLYSSAPHRGFRADFTITGASDASLIALSLAMETRLTKSRDRIEARRIEIKNSKSILDKKWQNQLTRNKNSSPISPIWISHCLSAAIEKTSVVIRESPLDLRYLDRTDPSTLFGGASGLGWGLGGAIGAKLANPNNLIVATEGDGAYMFSNPVSAHYISAKHNLPFLTVIFNNQHWEAVKRATHKMYPDGYAKKSSVTPLTNLEPSPHFEKIVAASDGYGEKVTKPEEVPKALERGINSVIFEKRQAVLNIICGG